MKKNKQKKVVIGWSIHQCKKLTIDGDSAGCEVGYITVQSKGEKKERLMHRTLGKALNHVGI